MLLYNRRYGRQGIVMAIARMTDENWPIEFEGLLHDAHASRAGVERGDGLEEMLDFQFGFPTAIRLRDGTYLASWWSVNGPGELCGVRWAKLQGRPLTQNLYEAVGGMPFFERLVGRFYAGVAGDPILRPLYPDEDLADATRRLTLFLAQYWGGPTTYNDERGHPRLRMRHVPFAIGTTERDRWLVHMRAALDAEMPPPEVADQLLRYFDMAAEAMRNRDVTGTSGRRPYTCRHRSAAEREAGSIESKGTQQEDADARQGAPSGPDEHEAPAQRRGKTVHGEAANAGHRVLASDDAEVEVYLETALNAPAPERPVDRPGGAVPRGVATASEPDTVVVIDFGSQYAQLIARRVRELHVYSELVPFDTPWSEIEKRRPRAVILSGGPASVYEPGAPKPGPGHLDVRRAGPRDLLRAPADGPGARRRGDPRPAPRVRARRASRSPSRTACSAASSASSRSG